MLHHDVDKGWVTSDGEPRWRSTEAALNRATGAELRWLSRPRCWVAHPEKGPPLAVIRCVGRSHNRRWQVRIEGFDFWHFNRIMKREMFDPVAGFDKIGEAKRFTCTVLRQAGARI